MANKICPTIFTVGIVCYMRISYIIQSHRLQNESCDMFAQSGTGVCACVWVCVHARACVIVETVVVRKIFIYGQR